MIRIAPYAISVAVLVVCASTVEDVHHFSTRSEGATGRGESK